MILIPHKKVGVAWRGVAWLLSRLDAPDLMSPLPRHHKVLITAGVGAICCIFCCFAYKNYTSAGVAVTFSLMKAAADF
jgi:hypothetical protein